MLLSFVRLHEGNWLFFFKLLHAQMNVINDNISNSKFQKHRSGRRRCDVMMMAVSSRFKKINRKIVDQRQIDESVDNLLCDKVRKTHNICVVTRSRS